MSDFWIPENPAIAQIVMKIDAVKFEITQVEAEADKVMAKIDRTRTLIYQVERNLEFLESRKARVILLTEYKIAKRNLSALKAEERGLLALMEQHERSHDRLHREINNLQQEAAKYSGKVLRFKKRDQEGQGPET